MNKQKRKGDRYEKEITEELKRIGISTIHISHSLQAGRNYKGDLIINVSGREFVGEVKYRQDGFKTIYKWLEERDILFIKARRKKWLIVIPIENLEKMMK